MSIPFIPNVALSFSSKSSEKKFLYIVHNGAIMTDEKSYYCVIFYTKPYQCESNYYRYTLSFNIGTEELPYISRETLNAKLNKLAHVAYDEDEELLAMRKNYEFEEPYMINEDNIHKDGYEVYYLTTADNLDDLIELLTGSE